MILIAIFFSFAIAAQTKLMSLKRPVCEPSEPCLIKVAGFPIQFCRCPGEKSTCHTSVDYRITFLDVPYQFCSKPEVQICDAGDVAWVRKGFRQFVRCICPEPLTLTSRKWNEKLDITEYICEKENVCDLETKCAVREHGLSSDGSPVSNLKNLCRCPKTSRCEMLEISVIQEGRQKEFGYCKM